MTYTMFTFIRRLLLSSMAVLALSACSPEKPTFNSIDVTGADYAKGFTLTDYNGQTRSLSDFKGKVWCYFLATRNAPMCAPPR
jgi:protein SCO1/2